MRFILRHFVAVLFVFLILIGSGIFLVMRFGPKPSAPVVETPVVPQLESVHKVIGQSVEGRNIESFTFGNGEKHVVFVGGIHGGYEWNSVLLAYQFVDYLKLNPAIIPANVSVTVIPAANPDGVFKVIGKEGRFALSDVLVDKAASVPGRFNAHGIDLNRNFACKWKPTSTWQSKVVSAGTAAFSEPEAAALRDFFLAEKPAVAIFWHSQSDAVYASECEAGILPETLVLMNAYSLASGYPPVPKFDAYEISGDAEGWLASIGIPALTVELKTHETIEWEQNLAGVQAILNHYK